VELFSYCIPGNDGLASEFLEICLLFAIHHVKIILAIYEAEEVKDVA